MVAALQQLVARQHARKLQPRDRRTRGDGTGGKQNMLGGNGALALFVYKAHFPRPQKLAHAAQEVDLRGFEHALNAAGELGADLPLAREDRTHVEVHALRANTELLAAVDPGDDLRRVEQRLGGDAAAV